MRKKKNNELLNNCTTCGHYGVVSQEQKNAMIMVLAHVLIAHGANASILFFLVYNFIF
jgi:hypothetical protein